ncbi:MAG: SDR family NAD(P)-dependent oxidoreductase [Thermoleophilaceae bacterium]|nr:SDR family NAD(P)-dependent oxidoreductase [Thermoleophilaceae bacterium]
MRLSDATVLVTGANRGIGRALAAELAKHSERVYAGVRNPAAFEPIEGDLRAEVLPLAIDLSSRASIDASFAQSREQLAGVDVLVNNAGLLSVGLLEEQDADAYYAMMQVNLVGLIHLTQLMLPAMLQRGSGQIVNNASISGYAYFPLASTYAASKAGVVAFSESLRRELRGTGVGVTHLITPGVKTDMLGETRDAYGSHIDTSGWDEIPAEEWAARVVAGIERDEAAVMPSGKPALTVKLAGGPRVLLDRVAARIFTR